MSDDLKKKATQQKRRAEGKNKHKKGRKPVVVSHKNLKEDVMLNEGKKNKPNNPKLWSRAQAWARKKFDVHPSAYSNLAASKWYKERGGTWRSTNESYLPTFKEWLDINAL